MRKIETYLRRRELPKEERQAHKIRVQATLFTLIGDSLYRQSFGELYLKCLNDPKVQYILVDKREGEVDSWSGLRRLPLIDSTNCS